MSVAFWKRPMVIAGMATVVVAVIVLVAITTNRVSNASAPLSVHAVAGDASATITWSPPSSSGGGAIDHYVVSANPGVKSCTAALTSCTIEGLTNETVYTFTVVAMNSGGAGARSSPSNSVTPLAACTGPADWPTRAVTADVRRVVTQYYATRHLAPITIENNREMVLNVAEQSKGVHHCTNPDGSVSGYVGAVPANATAAVMVQVAHLPYPVTGSTGSFVTLATTPGTGWKVVNEGTGP